MSADSNAVIGWHFASTTLRDGALLPKAGEVLSMEGYVLICHRGYHASEKAIDALQYAPGHYVARVRVWGDLQVQHDKICGRCRETLAAYVDVESELRAFARAQALSVAHLWDAPQVVLDYLRSGDESFRAAAWTAVRAAARVADRNSARAAARAVAWTAVRGADRNSARAAARDVARGAARDAAWAAARGDARDAAWDAANRDLEMRLMRVVERPRDE